MTQPPPGNDPRQYGGQLPLGQPGYGHPQYSGGQPPADGPPGYPGGYDQQPPKKNAGLIAAVGVIVLLLIAGAVGGFLLLRDDNKDTDNTGKEKSTSAPPTSVTPPAGDAYCAKLKAYDKDKELKALDFSTEQGQDKLLDVLRDLESSAPDQLKDDYQVFITGFIAVNDGKPESIDQEKFTAAFENIAKDSKDNCGVDLHSG